VSLALWLLANLAFDQGRPGEAAALRREALALCRELDDRYFVAPQLEDFGEAAAAEGDGERALRLAGAAAALRAAAGTPPTAPEQARLDRWLAPVAAAVSDAVRARSWAEGQTMTREDAVAYALAAAPRPWPSIRRPRGPGARAPRRRPRAPAGTAGDGVGSPQRDGRSRRERL
jgi:hypothetical protein